MEHMENQEDCVNDLPPLPRSYEEFCKSIPLEQDDTFYDVDVSRELISASEELFEDNQYPLLDDFLSPQSITEFFQLNPLYAKVFLPDDMFQQLFSKRISSKELSDVPNDPSTTNVAPNNKVI
ncbi:hypothetical protein HN51_028756 [Arachis hypogaea]